MDDTRPISRLPGSAGRFLQRRLLRRGDDGAHPRNWLHRPSADTQRAGADETARASGDGGRRARRRFVADLRAGVLREDGRADCAGQSRVGTRRNVYLAHSQRRNAFARSRGRVDRHFARRKNSRRVLPSKSRRAVELGQAGCAHQKNRSRPGRRTAHHRRHVHLHRRPDRSGRHDAALGAGRRLQSLDRATERPDDPRTRPARDGHPHRQMGELFRRLGFTGQNFARRFQKRQAQAVDRQNAGGRGGDAGQIAGGNGDGPGDRRWQPRQHGLFSDVGGECAQRNRSAVGQLWL